MHHHFIWIQCNKIIDCMCTCLGMLGPMFVYIGLRCWSCRRLASFGWPVGNSTETTSVKTSTQLHNMLINYSMASLVLSGCLRNCPHNGEQCNFGNLHSASIQDHLIDKAANRGRISARVTSVCAPVDWPCVVLQACELMIGGGAG